METNSDLHVINPETKPDGKGKLLREILMTAVYLVLILCLALLIVNFIGQRTVVSGSSMEPTLSDGDNLIIDKISYRFRNPRRFEIVVFPDPMDPSVYFIKRVIGLPGETVRIDEEGNIRINGEILKESYGWGRIQDPGDAGEAIALGEDQYFVMGDNRNNSLDSRFAEVGPISGDDFIGRALCRIYPFNQIRGLLPKEEKE